METFMELVKEMRTTQKAYFKNRDKATLLKSKDLERRVDQMIQDQEPDQAVKHPSNQLNFLS